MMILFDKNMKSNKGKNTIMTPKNSLTNVSLMGNFDVMSKLPFIVLFLFVVQTVWHKQTVLWSKETPVLFKKNKIRQAEYQKIDITLQQRE